MHAHVCRYTDSDNQHVRSLSCGQCMTLRKHLAEEHGHGEPWQVVMPGSERMTCDFCWWKMLKMVEASEKIHFCCLELGIDMAKSHYAGF